MLAYFVLAISLVSGVLSAPTRRMPEVTKLDHDLHRRQLSGKSSGIVDVYHGQNMFDEWTFFGEEKGDPTRGLSKYQSKEDALAKKLAHVDDAGYTWLVTDDHSQLALNQSRDTIRMTSKTYSANQGPVLFVLDVQKMPTGCSNWPAFWLNGAKQWPAGGEVDILEGVNLNDKNQYTLHTTAGCELSTDNAPVTAKPSDHKSCAVEGSSNTGCAFFDTNPKGFGKGLNDNGGGVYLTLWDNDAGIRIWFFSAAEIPADVMAGTPTPEGWGDPAAFYSKSSCSMDHFSDLSMIINNAICGDWAGGAYSQSKGCPGTCAEAAMDPANFKDAKWQLNYVAVYRGSSGAGSPPAMSSAAAAEPAPSDNIEPMP